MASASIDSDGLPKAEEGRLDFESPASTADQSPIALLALRDLAIVLVALSLWAAADAWTVATGLGFASALSVLDGVLVGALVTLLIHEWGHFAGARWGGGVAPTTKLERFFPLFVYDMDRSDARSFRWMGIGGNLTHWAVVAILALALPLDTPGRIALVSSAFGFAVFGSVTEVPVVQRAYAGATARESFAGITSSTLWRNGAIGAGAGLLSLALLW